MYLLNNNFDPYDGVFHEPPHELYFYKLLLDNLSPTFLSLVFICCDLLTSVLIYQTVKRYVNHSHQRQNKILLSREIGDTKKRTYEELHIFIRNNDHEEFATYAFYFYLLSPLIICNCVGKTTTVFLNLKLAISLFGIVYKRYYFSVFFHSLATLQRIYPLALISPILIKFTSIQKVIKLKIVIIICTLVLMLTITSSFLILSKELSGSWSFINNVYGFILNIEDVSPNIGLWWYLFMEIFVHFRKLFTASYQINSLFLYIIPLSIKLHQDPFFLAVIILIFNTIFNPYPCLGNTGFYIALLPAFTNLLSYVSILYFFVHQILSIYSLGPVMLYHWLVTNSGNANFFFGLTLFLGVSQVFIMLGMLYVYVKREMWLSYSCDVVFKTRRVRLFVE